MVKYGRRILRRSLYCVCIVMLTTPVHVNAQHREVNDFDGTNKAEAASSTPMPLKFRAPGSKPGPLYLDCSKDIALNMAGMKGQDDSPEYRQIEQTLKLLNKDYGHTIFTLAHADVMWWVRVFGTLSIATLPAALHESHHAINWALSRCENGHHAYFLNGRVYRTKFKQGDLPNYSAAGKYLPKQFKTTTIGSRYGQYILKNGTAKNTDYSVLLDELVAYVGGAGIEREIVRETNLTWLIPTNLTKLNGNLGGMIDFMLYTLSYLKAVRLDAPDAYAIIKADVESIKILENVWKFAEKELQDSYPFTDCAQANNLLNVRLEVLRAIYSEEFLQELDELKLQHLTWQDWKATYFKCVPANNPAIN